MSRNSEDCAVETCEKAIKLLRIQRHDFMNHLQVIHTMVQMGRTQKVLEYIENISKNSSWIAGIIAEYNIDNKCD